MNLLLMHPFIAKAVRESRPANQRASCGSSLPPLRRAARLRGQRTAGFTWHALRAAPLSLSAVALRFCIEPLDERVAIETPVYLQCRRLPIPSRWFEPGASLGLAASGILWSLAWQEPPYLWGGRSHTLPHMKFQVSQSPPLKCGASSGFFRLLCGYTWEAIGPGRHSGSRRRS
jgi:hypothetical protein